MHNGRTTVLLAILLVAAGCGSPAPSPIDPGKLEVWNGLRDEVLVVLGGRPFRAAPCRVTAFEAVDRRGVRLATTGGVVLAAFDTDPDTAPIGPHRYLVVGAPFAFQEGRATVFDLRTRPVVPEPDGRTCSLTVEDLLNPSEPGQPPQPGGGGIP